MNKNNKILIVEDDISIREMLLYIMQKEAYQVTAVDSAEAALAYCQTDKPDLVLLDIELPGKNGYQFCESLNQHYHNNMPIIIMLTDQSDVSDIEKGLASYADDYIAKPFNPRILIARITAALRRQSSVTEPVVKQKATQKIEHLGIVIDMTSRQVTVNSENIKLQKMEFDILFLLMSSPNRVFSRDAIITYSKGDNYYITDRAIDNQIYKLRKKLGDAGAYLETVSGIGYRFCLT